MTFGTTYLPRSQPPEGGVERRDDRADRGETKTARRTEGEQMKFPKVLYVRQDEDGDETYLTAYENIGDTVKNDGPTEVAIYNLTNQTQTYEKVVQAVGKK